MESQNESPLEAFTNAEIRFLKSNLFKQIAESYQKFSSERVFLYFLLK